MCECSCTRNILFAFILIVLAIMSVEFVPLAFIEAIEAYPHAALYHTQQDMNMNRSGMNPSANVAALMVPSLPTLTAPNPSSNINISNMSQNNNNNSNKNVMKESKIKIKQQVKPQPSILGAPLEIQSLSSGSSTIFNDYSRDEILFVSIVNYRENIMAENWILSMIRAGFQNNFRLITLDEIAFNRYSTFIQRTIDNVTDINQYLYPMNDELPKENTFIKPWERDQKIPFKFGRSSFKYLTCLRPVVIKHLLTKVAYSTDPIWNKYNGLVVIDVDTFMYKSEQAWHTKLKTYWNDTIVFGVDLPGTLICSCLLFIGNINQGKVKELNIFLDHWNKQCNVTGNRDDQSSLGTTLQKLPNIKYKLFDSNQFPNGAKFTIRMPNWQNQYLSKKTLNTYAQMTQEQVDNDPLFPYMIHANYMSNDAGYTKIKFLKRFKAWLVSDNQTQNEFGRKLWD
eukprot:661859_1